MECALNYDEVAAVWIKPVVRAIIRVGDDGGDETFMTTISLASMEGRADPGAIPGLPPQRGLSVRYWLEEEPKRRR